MKWILIAILIAVIMLIAYSISEQYKDKFDFYNNLKNFLLEFKINLSFKQEKINDFLSKTKCKKQFSYFIEAYRKYLSTGALDLKDISILDDDERAELEEIVQSIGKNNVNSEIGQLETFLAKVDGKLAKADEDKKKLCPMIIKLSLLFAIGLAIILV